VTLPGKEDAVRNVDAVPEASPGTVPEGIEGDKPFWPVAAAFLGAGFGALVLGVLTTLAEASSSLKDWLAFSSQVGPLSGKTIIAVAAWLVAWAVLSVTLRGRDIKPQTVYWITGLMVALGLLGTFPSFFERFAKE
jgi:hypothetical protein